MGSAFPHRYVLFRFPAEIRVLAEFPLSWPSFAEFWRGLGLGLCAVRGVLSPVLVQTLAYRVRHQDDSERHAQDEPGVF